MTTNLLFPKWGMGIEEGTIIQWFKAVGESFEEGEPLVEIETAKVTQEVPAPTSGTLVEILLREGETAAVNTAIAVIEENPETA